MSSYFLPLNSTFKTKVVAAIMEEVMVEEVVVCEGDVNLSKLPLETLEMFPFQLDRNIGLFHFFNLFQSRDV